MLKIITWIDLQGRYRVTSPAYDSLKRLHGLTEDQAIDWTWNKLVVSGGYGIAIDHPHYLVEDADQRARVAECCGTYFRHTAIPDSEGRLSAVGGAWEMDLDGRPKVNMPKARLVHMDHIRKVRDAELVKESGSRDRLPQEIEALLTPERQARLQILRNIPQTFALGKYRTPATLKAAWPSEFPGSA